MSKKEDQEEELLNKANPEELNEVEESSEIEQPQMKEESTEKKLEELKTELATIKDQLLRKNADFENYRKRMAREKQDSFKFANQPILTDLVDVIDNFDRALSSEGEETASFKEGIVMVEKQFSGLLADKYYLKRMVCVGEGYNPKEHEALQMTESKEVEEPTVIEEYQSGYKLHERVIRSAKVRVAMPVKENKEKEENNEGED